MKLLISLILLSACTVSAVAQETLTAQAAVAQSAMAADGFLKSLSETQAATVVFSFTDEEQRHNWSNLPIRMAPRGGLRWGDLNQTQKDALNAVLKATLSKAGYQQVVDNMGGDEVLRTQSDARRQAMFGRDEYYVSFLGKPSADRPWMLQFGGHHLAFNVTIFYDKMTISPSLTGGQPMDYTLDGRTVRQLAAEEDKSFELVASLNLEQQKQVVLAGRYTDMIFGPGKEGAQPQQQGMNASQLNPKQRELLMELISERLGLMKDVFAKPRIDQIKKDLDQTWLAWYGETQKDGAATFRIQGPTILMEYSPQRLGGVPMNHIHAMYRDPTNDYGVGFLKKETHRP